MPIKIIDILMIVGRYTALTLIWLIIFVLWRFVIRPWMIRRRYRKYENVGMWRHKSPIFQDILMVFKNERENKFRFQHYFDIGKI